MERLVLWDLLWAPWSQLTRTRSLSMYLQHLGVPRTGTSLGHHAACRRLQLVRLFLCKEGLDSPVGAGCSRTAGNCSCWKGRKFVSGSSSCTDFSRAFSSLNETVLQNEPPTLSCRTCSYSHKTFYKDTRPPLPVSFFSFNLEKLTLTFHPSGKSLTDNFLDR